jgi:Subtilase family
MRQRILGAALLLITVWLSPGPVRQVAAQRLPTRHAGNIDRQLNEVLERAFAHHIEGRPDLLVAVEVLTTDNRSVEQAVNQLGGTVTGSVDGQLVAALVPADAVNALSAVGAARYVQRPLRVNRLPPTETVGFGPTVGDEVAVTNAAAWQNAGFTGNVKVGIIDFFDLTFWNTNEQGPAPDAAHQFCPDRTEGLCTPTGQINSANGDRHGVAVAEIVKDMAPGAELFLATTADTTETQSAIDWFVANGVHIITRSLGAPYDGPGDGTGPLDSVVDYAAARGITWFNSGGNDAAFGYGRYTNGVDANGYVDFDNGPGVDTVLRIDPSSGGVAFDGIRWANDWHLPPALMTDYSVEIWEGISETSRFHLTDLNNSQIGGATPLEAVDASFALSQGQALFIRIHLNAHYSPSEPDTIEVATFYGVIEAGRQSASFSAAKPVVDSASPSLLAVGAIDPANGSTGIAFYSSQGPTNDGRIKPDISAPSCVKSTIYPVCFNGTSAAAPTAAGMAALLLGQGLAAPGMPLAALTKHLASDLGPPGPDNSYGTGEIQLPAPPVAVASAPSTFTALGAPVRLLDTRPTSFIGPAATLVGPYPQFAIIDLPISSSGVIPATATSVAVNITSTDSVSPFYVQALPKLGGAIGEFSTTNVAAPGRIQPNFAIVPLGQGSISIFIPTGGNIIVDAMGYFTPSGGPTTAGRFVPVNPHRVLDTRPAQAGPVPVGWTPHQPVAGETVRIDVPADAGVPTSGVSALVVNVTATEPPGAGFMQVLPTGAAPGQTSNVNYAAGDTTATHAIVPLGAGGTISVFTSNASHIVVDVMGYITDGTVPASSAGEFVPLTPNRYYDSRSAPHTIHAGLSTVSVQLAGAPFAVPVGAAAVSMNVTSDQATGAGYLTVYPSDGPFPLASNLNYVAATPVANAGLVKLSATGTVNTFVNVATHVIIDVNGYFTGTT